jgi:hypothetical protein
MTLTVAKRCVNETEIVLPAGLRYGANQETTTQVPPHKRPIGERSCDRNTGEFKSIRE